MILEYWIPSGKLTYLWKDPPVLMGKSTISMAIFNSYVKLPEGIYSILLFAYVVQVWLRSWVMQSLYANKPPNGRNTSTSSFLVLCYTLPEKKATHPITSVYDSICSDIIR